MVVINNKTSESINMLNLQGGQLQEGLYYIENLSSEIFQNINKLGIKSEIEFSVDGEDIRKYPSHSFRKILICSSGQAWVIYEEEKSFVINEGESYLLPKKSEKIVIRTLINTIFVEASM
ncbi:MAG: hypothetical protein N4A32_00755 [Marinifilaceae bacterium]|jgi:Fe-S cluster biosynthesis and repair protein YggX|nr:hypothetical protein [Marinifilaceae bacterium]